MSTQRISAENAKANSNLDSVLEAPGGSDKHPARPLDGSHTASSKADALAQSSKMLAALFEPSDWIVFHPISPDAGGPKLWATIADGEIDSALQWVWDLNNGKRKHCAFFGANVRRGEGQSGAEGTAFARSHFADFDGVTVEQAVDKIAAAGLPAPTVTLSSGRGVHVYWRLHDIVEDFDQWTHRQKWIAAALGSDDAVIDAQRLMRLPGFINRKEKYKSDPPTARLVECEPGRRFSWKDIQPKLCAEPAAAVEPERMPKRERRAGEVLPGDDFDDRGDWLEALPAGWAPLPGRGEIRAWSMAGPRGRKTASVKSGAIYVWDSDFTLLPAGGWVSKFGAFAYCRHGGDFKAAAAALYAAGYGSRPVVTPVEPARVEPLAVVETVSLESLRATLAEDFRRVAAERPALAVCSHDTGSGKTFAAIEHFVRAFDVCTINVATHEAAGEMVEKLAAAGVAGEVAAFPPIDALTCRCFTDEDAAELEAEHPDSSTLSMTRALKVGQPYLACRACPLFSTPSRGQDWTQEPGQQFVACEYQRRKQAAERASIRVQCQERTRRRPEAVQAPAGLTAGLFSDENASAVLLPRVEILGEDFATVAECLEVAVLNWRAHKAGMRWSSAREQEHELLGWAEAVAGVARRIANDIAERIEAGVPGVYDLPDIEPLEPPARASDKLGRLLARAELPGGFNAQALDIVRRASAGTLSGVTIVIVEQPGGVGASVVHCWKFEPAGVCHLVADAHADMAGLRRMFPDMVELAPPGRAPLVSSAEQYWLEIAPRTTLEKVVESIERALDSNGWQRAGLILTKRHRQALFPWSRGADGRCADRLPTVALIAGYNGRGRRPLAPTTLPARQDAARALLARLAAIRIRLARDAKGRLMVEHHLGAGSRGTNRFLGMVDGLAVVGLTRVNPGAIAAAMIASGQRHLAHAGGQWGDCAAELPTVEGVPGRFNFRGYADPDWASAAAGINRAALLQAAGRARSRLAGGCPLVVVAAEPTGLPVRVWVESPGRLAAVVEALGGCQVGQTRQASAEESIYAKNSQKPLVSQKDEKRENSLTCQKVSRTPAIVRGGSIFSPPILLAGVRDTPGLAGVTVADLVEALGVGRRAVQKWLAEAVAAGVVVRTGAARATRYHLAPVPGLPVAVELPAPPPITATTTAPDPVEVVELLEVAEPPELLEARRVSAELAAAMPMVARAVELFGTLARVAPPPPPPRVSREVRKLLVPAIDFITSADRRQGMGHIGTGPDRITFKVFATSPRGRLIPAGEARAVAAWRAQQASP